MTDEAPPKVVSIKGGVPVLPVEAAQEKSVKWVMDGLAKDITEGSIKFLAVIVCDHAGCVTTAWTKMPRGTALIMAKQLEEDVWDATDARD